MIRAKSVFDLEDFDWENVKAYQGAFKDQPAFLLGFAKSLNDIDLSRLENRWVLGINWLVRRMKPSFSFSLDPQPVSCEYDRLKEAQDTTLVVARKDEKFYYPPDVKKTFFSIPFLQRSGTPAVYCPRMGSHFYGTATSASYAALWLFACGFDPIVMVGADFDIEESAVESPGSYVQLLQSDSWASRFPRINTGQETFRDFVSATAETHAEAVPAHSPRDGFSVRTENAFFRKFVDELSRPSGRMIVNASAFRNPQFDAVPWWNFDQVVDKLDKDGHLR